MPNPAYATAHGRSLSTLGLLVLALVGAAGFMALGVWQLERRVWKLEMIQRVGDRIHADPVAVPTAAAWPEIDAAKDAYRRVRLTGRFLHDRETLVQAVTEHGGGWWVLTPLRTPQGTTILVNRGFVSPQRRDGATRQAGNPGEVEVTGLLRMSEPAGFLRRNDPGADRWYSRDVAAIATARGLTHVAPFFIDADGAANPGGWPIGGLTVVAFRNEHLVYALTWFALAVMAAAVGAVVGRDEWRRRRRLNAADAPFPSRR
ncbi:MAG: SURF1 family protein [Pseudomonadota bacterium]